MGKGIDSDEYGGHKRTRFPCLATARYVVAAVVSVLTVAVVVMVIIVALRPEKVTFSIPHQYIEADRLWWVPGGVTDSSEHAPIPSRVGGGGRAASVVKTNAGTATSTKTAGRVIINDTDANADPDIDTSFPSSSTAIFPVKNVTFLVSFTADNPSGRADVWGESVTIRVLDMPNYGGSPAAFSYFQTTTLREIVTHELQDRFLVKRQTSHTLRKWIVVHDADVLSYLAVAYGGWSSFTAMVHLTANISGASMNPQIYYCWPLIVSMSSGYYDRSTSCRPEKEMDSNVSYSRPPPAPVPVPVPAPAPTAAAR